MRYCVIVSNAVPNVKAIAYVSYFAITSEKGNTIMYLMANGMFKKKITLDRHGLRLMPENCQHLDPPNFSLQTNFKGQRHKISVECCHMHTA
jgi:hypothetical protein